MPALQQLDDDLLHLLGRIISGKILLQAVVPQRHLPLQRLFLPHDEVHDVVLQFPLRADLLEPLGLIHGGRYLVPLHEELEVGGVYYGEMRRVNGQSVNQSVLHDVTPLYHLQGLVGGIHGNKDTAEMVYNQLVWMSQNKAEQ